MDMFQRMQETAAADAEVTKQTAFQERVVKQLLRYANININLAAAKRKANDEIGSPDLDFNWFNGEYPQYPVRLLAQKLKYTHVATIGQLFGKNKIRTLPWYDEYRKQVDLYDIDLRSTRAALVFNLPYAKDAFLMTLHNQPVQAEIIHDAEHRQDDPGPRLIVPFPQHDITLVLETFQSFLQTVGNDWAGQ